MLTLDKKDAIINGKVVELNVAPEVNNQRTMVPLRFISENLDASVGWNGDTQLVSLGQNCDKDIFESKQSCSVNIPVISKEDLKTREQISKLLNDTTSLLNNSNGLVITQEASINGMNITITIIKDKRDKELSVYTDTMGILSSYIYYTPKDFGNYQKNSNKWTNLNNITNNDIGNIFNESILDTHKIKDIKYFDNIEVKEDNNFVILNGTTQTSSLFNRKYSEIINQSNSSQFNSFNGDLNFEMKINRYNKQLKSFKVYGNFMGMNISADTYIDQMDNAPKVLPIKNIESGEIPKEASRGELEVHFIDVGKGDAIYIKTPSNEDILIDGGNKIYAEDVIDYLNDKIKDKKIEYVIATHYHGDHISGLPTILNEFNFETFYIPDIEKTGYKPGENSVYKELADLVGKNKMKPIDNGDCLPTSNITAEFLAPDFNLLKENANQNDYSAVLYIKYGNNKFLFTGDIQKESELTISKNYNNLEVDLLKVAHHGSDSSTSEYFINTLTKNYPIKYGIITTTKTDNERPRDIVVNNLKSHSPKIILLRTGDTGDIAFKSNGNIIEIIKK